MDMQAVSANAGSFAKVVSASRAVAVGIDPITEMANCFSSERCMRGRASLIFEILSAGWTSFVSWMNFR